MGIFRIKKKFKSKYQRQGIDDDLLVTKSVFKGKGFAKSNLYAPTRGEQNIIDYLKSSNINFIREKTFKKLINPFTKQQLRMDFYLPKHKVCIEFDGKQHSEVVQRFNMTNDSLHYQKVKDSIKNEFCVNNQIKMIRIAHTEINKVAEILKANL